MDPFTRHCERFEAKQNLRMPLDMKNRWYSVEELQSVNKSLHSRFLRQTPWRQVALWRAPEQLPEPEEHFELISRLWSCEEGSRDALLSSYVSLWTFEDDYWDHLGLFWGFSYLYWFCPWIETRALCEAFSITPRTAYILRRGIQVIGMCERCEARYGHWWRSSREESEGVFWCDACRWEYQSKSEWPTPCVLKPTEKTIEEIVFGTFRPALPDDVGLPGMPLDAEDEPDILFGILERFMSKDA